MPVSKFRQQTANLVCKLQNWLATGADESALEPRLVHLPGSNAMKFTSLLLLGAGLTLLVCIGLALEADPFDIADPARTFGLLLLALLPLLHRGLLRKFYFGSGLSLHQACSFEVIFQVTRWFSPLLPSKAFQVAFHTRETGHGRTATLRWQSIFSGSAYAAMALAATIALALSGLWLTASLAALMTVVITVRGYLASSREADNTANFLAAWVGLSANWMLEAAIFAVITRGLLDTQTALVTWIAVALLNHRPAVPLGLGIIQLPALMLTGAAGATTLAMLNSYVLVKSLALATLGMLYLARYKLKFLDLLSARVIGRLLRSQRPRGGWTVSPDVENSPVKLSVIIPAYNEERRLPPYLDTVREHLQEKHFEWEIVVVDDGSRDDTFGIIEKAGKAYSRIRPVRQAENLGKGAAVARGVREARGRYVIFADADGATPAIEIDKAMATLELGTEIVVGSRTLHSESVDRERATTRKLLGKAFYRVVNFFAVPGISDTQCGFKGFRLDVARHLFSNLNEKRWAFDIEILYRAQLLGYGITEIPIRWSEVPGSKLNPFADGFRMALAIFRIRRQNAGFLKSSADRDGSISRRPAETQP